MNIAAIDPIPSRLRGGQERSLFDILTGLSNRGHRIALSYCQAGDLLPKYEKAGVQCHQIHRTWVENKGRPAEWIELLQSASCPAFKQADVIYVNQFSDVPVACLAKASYGTRVVCHLRLPPMPYGFQHRFFRRRIDRYITATSNMQEKHIATGWPASSLRIIPNGFAFPLKRPSWPRPMACPLRILFLGRITRPKGIDIALDIVESLRNMGESVCLDVFGPVMREDQRQYRDELQCRVEQQNLPVQFWDPVADTHDLFPRYDLCLFPSRWDEAFGRVPVESIMSGVPVIVRDVGALREIMGPAGQPWIFKDTDDAVCLVRSLINHPDRYPLSEIYAWMKAHYDQEAILPRIEALLLEVANRRCNKYPHAERSTVQAIPPADGTLMNHISSEENPRRL